MPPRSVFFSCCWDTACPVTIAILIHAILPLQSLIVSYPQHTGLIKQAETLPQIRDYFSNYPVFSSILAFSNPPPKFFFFFADTPSCIKTFCFIYFRKLLFKNFVIFFCLFLWVSLGVCLSLSLSFVHVHTHTWAECKICLKHFWLSLHVLQDVIIVGFTTLNHRHDAYFS